MSIAGKIAIPLILAGGASQIHVESQPPVAELIPKSIASPAGDIVASVEAAPPVSYQIEVIQDDYTTGPVGMFEHAGVDDWRQY